jgi:hypothetical protein
MQVKQRASKTDFVPENGRRHHFRNDFNIAWLIVDPIPSLIQDPVPKDVSG